MIQTYAEARAAALAHMSPWQGPGATPYAAPDGLEDGTDYLVPVGTEEDLSAGDAGPHQVDDMVLLVSKVTGEVRPASVLSEQEKFNRMRPVRENPGPGSALAEHPRDFRIRRAVSPAVACIAHGCWAPTLSLRCGSGALLSWLLHSSADRQQCCPPFTQPRHQPKPTAIARKTTHAASM